ncbi:MAG: hypothetical protein O2960_16995 [Verrucomicrobia bacterium]|nr:hypothetical protein [Verrucomicrobiota bacterium]
MAQNQFPVAMINAQTYHVPEMEWAYNWLEGHAGDAAIKTGVLIGLVLLIRIYGLHKLRQTESLTPELRRRWMVQVRQSSWLLILFGGVIIWGQK